MGRITILARPVLQCHCLLQVDDWFCATCTANNSIISDNDEQHISAVQVMAAATAYSTQQVVRPSAVKAS